MEFEVVLMLVVELLVCPEGDDPPGSHLCSTVTMLKPETQ